MHSRVFIFIAATSTEVEFTFACIIKHHHCLRGLMAQYNMRLKGRIIPTSVKLVTIDYVQFSSMIFKQSYSAYMTICIKLHAVRHVIFYFIQCGF